jgi:hypothetical protein
MNIFRKVSQILLRKKGWDVDIYNEYQKRFEKDRLYNPNTTAAQKRWAHRRGFASDKIERYGLTEENYRDFISELEYAWGYPYNGTFARWIDDKLTMCYTLRPFRSYLPEYYFLISEEGRWYRLFDCPETTAASSAGLIRLLKERGHLALKPFAGTEGTGFLHFAYRDGFHVNGKAVTEQELREYTEGLRDYLITEYLMPSPELARIFPTTANTLRIITINLPGIEDPICKGMIRFGSKASKEVDNTSQGGIFCYLDVKTGAFKDGYQDIHFRRFRREQHPDTGALMAGIVPDWPEIRKLVLDICNYMPELVLLGFDVVHSTNGIKLIEINSLPEHMDYQVGCPLKKDPHYGRLWQSVLERKGPMPG